MRHGFFFLTAFVLLFIVEDLEASDVKDRQLVALEAAFLELEDHYGLLPFKSETFGLQLDELREKYRGLIQDGITVEEALGLSPQEARDHLSKEDFEQLMIAFSAEFWDGHTLLLREHTTNYWTLGIYAADIDGRLFVTGFHPELFKKGQTSPELKVGDEIVAVDGQSIEEAIAPLLPYVTMATYETRRELALHFLLNRSHHWLRSLKDHAEIHLRFRRKRSGKPPLYFNGTFHWLNRKDYNKAYRLIPEAELPDHVEKKFVYGYSSKDSYFLEGLSHLIKEEAALMAVDERLNQEIKDVHKAIGLKSNKNTAKNRIPSERLDRLKPLEPSETFQAKILRYKDKNLGILRIPSYDYEEKDRLWLAEVIRRFEATVDMLLIDQLDNGGGYVESVTQLLRLFSHDRPLDVGTINIRLSERLLTDLEIWAQKRKSPQKKRRSQSGLKDKKLEEEDDDSSSEEDKETSLYPDRNYSELALNLEWVAELRKKFEAGEKFSGPIPNMGTAFRKEEGQSGQVIGREKFTFSKPVLLLNSSRSASGGDFFPALMQANQRALVLGETSAGLGGPIYYSQDSMPGSNLFMQNTYGLGTRPDGLPMENLGVVPDLPRWIGPADLRDEFKNYSKLVLAIAHRLASGDSTHKIEERYQQKIEDSLPADSLTKAMDRLQKHLHRIKDWSPQSVENAYSNFETSVQNKKISKVRWAKEETPLPRVLLESDLILASLRDPKAILSRLQQLRRLPAFTESKNTLAVMDLVENHLPRFLQTRRRPCFEAIKPFGQQRNRAAKPDTSP